MSYFGIKAGSSTDWMIAVYRHTTSRERLGRGFLDILGAEKPPPPPGFESLEGLL